MDFGKLVARDTPFYDAAKMLFHALRRDLPQNDRIVMRLVGDHADVIRVAFIAGPGMRELAQIECFHATSVTMISGVIAALGMRHE